jgi:hypothetical protein
MDVSWNTAQIRSMYHHYWSNPELYESRLERLEREYDVVTALLSADSDVTEDYRQFISSRLRCIIHTADLPHMVSWIGPLVASDSPWIDGSLFYGLLNAMPLSAIGPQPIIGSQFRQWLTELIAIPDPCSAELATTIKGLIVAGDIYVPERLHDLFQSLANRMQSSFIVSNVGLALTVWIGSSSFFRIMRDIEMDMNTANCLFIVFNHLHWSRMIDAEFELERHLIRETMTPLIADLQSRGLFEELTRNMLWFISLYEIDTDSDTFFQLLLRLPADCTTDLETDFAVMSRIETLSSDSPQAIPLLIRLKHSLHIVITEIHESEDVDLYDMLHTFSNALCWILERWTLSETQKTDVVRVLIHAMAEGQMDATRHIFSLFLKLGVDWLKESATMGIDETKLVDVIENAVYGHSELISHLYSLRESKTVAMSDEGALDPITMEPLGTDVVKLAGNVTVNRSTLERWREYGGTTNPYTREPL